MAASLRQMSAPGDAVTAAPSAVAVLHAPGRPYLVKLAALHDEAAETAHLAALLSRMPYVAGALALTTLALVLVWAGQVAIMPLAGWVALMLGSVIALSRAHGRGLEAPLERAALRFFARDSSAILLYAGFAWGAGLFLAVPLDAGLLFSFAFAAGMPAAVAAILRVRDMALWFLAPAAAMAAFVALMSPDRAEFALAGAILAGASLTAVAVSLFGRRPAIRALQG